MLSVNFEGMKCTWLTRTRPIDRFMPLHRIRIWLKGFGHGRGFGIQSPWAYHFVRYVIKEKWPYYAYARLSQEYPDYDSDDRRLAELYFRIANYSQSKRWGFCLDQFDIQADYVQAGCLKTSIVDCVDGYDMDQIAECDILVMTLEGNWKKIYSQFARHASSQSILIVEDIHVSRSAYKAWKMMQSNEYSGVSFDLYRCGLIFFDKQMYKQHYVLNF